MNTIQLYIGSQPPAGNTPTADAIKYATTYLQTVKDGNKKFILLATDGDPNCAPGAALPSVPDVPGTVLAITAAKDAGFPVYVIGIGPGSLVAPWAARN